MADYARTYDRITPGLCTDDVVRLKSYSWPGNVRELKNVIERSVIMSGPESLELSIPGIPLSTPALAGSSLDLPIYDPFSDKPSMEELQRRYIGFLLKETKGKINGKKGVAQILGMKAPTLYSRMKKLGISPAHKYPEGDKNRGTV